MITPDTLARVHARAFEDRGRAWRAEEFAALLASPHVIVEGDVRAFVLLRIVADEVEVLTVATLPEARRRGLARVALRGSLIRAANRGGKRAFLEVAEDNGAARAFYSSEGFCETGRRAAYYPRAEGAVDAIVMSRKVS